MSRESWTWRDYGYLLAVSLPPIVLTGMLITASVSWQKNSRALDHAIHEVVANADSRKDTAFIDWYNANRTDESTIELKTLAAAAAEVYWGLNSSYPSNRLESPLQVVPSGEPWPQGEWIEHFAELAQPILKRLERFAEQNHSGVWMPTDFGTLRPEIGSSAIPTLLQTEFLVAVHQGDRERALRVLQLFGSLYSYQSDSNPPGLIASYAHSLLGQMVRETMTIEFWSPDQLASLQQLMATEFDFDQQWRDAVTGELLFVLPALSDPDQAERLELNYRHTRFRSRKDQTRLIRQSTVSPSETTEAVKQFVSNSAISAKAGTYRHVQQVAALAQRTRQQLYVTDNAFHFDQWLKFPFLSGHTLWGTIANVEGSAHSLLIVANDQRWTRCTIAIKQYRTEFGKLPSNLKELEKVNFSARATWDYTGQPFRYRIAPDGSFARLWCHAADPPSDQDVGMADHGQVGMVFSQFAEIR